jgi:copper chaperone CopZ
MRRWGCEIVSLVALVVALGCSDSASVDRADLSNEDAAAMVAAETERTAAKKESEPETPLVQATPVAFNSEGAPTVDFSVPDMMCEHSCVPTVRETLAEQPGVKDVKVDLASKTATVAVEKDKFDADAAVAALVDLQFTETKLLGPTKNTAAN